MGNMILAAQLYTVRDYMKTPEEIVSGLKKVREAGYSSVQVSGIGPIDPSLLKEYVENEGLSVCATHISFERLKNDLQSVIKEHKLWNCKHVGLGSMPGVYSESEEGYQSFIKEISIIADILEENDLHFIYHNHNFEFKKIGNRIGLDILLEETDPEKVGFEIDTYWVQAGGGDPIHWIKECKGRMAVVHFKDMAISNENKQIMAEVGEGNLNWSGIIEACNQIGVQYCAVEQDICQRDPFESLAISYRNLKKMGL